MYEHQLNTTTFYFDGSLFHVIIWMLHWGYLDDIWTSCAELKSLYQSFLKISASLDDHRSPDLQLKIGCNSPIEIPLIQKSLLGLQRRLHYHHFRGTASNGHPKCISTLATPPHSGTSHTWSQAIAHN